MEYRKVELMFGELIMNAVKCEWISKRPYRLDEDSDVIIQNESRIKMSDGQEIELCFWCESDIYLVDVSVDKKKYDMAGTGMSFERYMLNKGMYTENIVKTALYSFLLSSTNLINKPFDLYEEIFNSIINQSRKESIVHDKKL